MSIDPIQLNDDNYKFFMQNKTSKLSCFDIAKDGHLVKVTWFKWVVRWIINWYTNGSIDHKVHQAFCNAILQKHPGEGAIPFNKFKDTVNRFTYLNALENDDAAKVHQTARGVLEEEEESKSEETPTPALDKSKRQLHLDDDLSSSDDEGEITSASAPKLSFPNEPLTLDMLENVLHSNGVSLENKDEENVDTFIDVLVEFAKHFSITDIVNKVVRMREYKLNFSRTVLTNMIGGKLESKVEADSTFLNKLHADNKKALETFVKQLEVAAKKKAEEAAAAKKAEEAAKEQEAPPAPTYPNRDILEEGIQLLEALIQNDSGTTDFDDLVESLKFARTIIEDYPKEEGIPADLAEKIVDFTQKLQEHVQYVYADKHNLTLLISEWKKITDHLGIEAPFELDTTEAEKSDELQGFVAEYLVKNCSEEMTPAEWDAREVSIADRVKEIIRENVGLDDVPMIEKICEEFGEKANDLVNKWLDRPEVQDLEDFE